MLVASATGACATAEGSPHSLLAPRLTAFNPLGPHPQREALRRQATPRSLRAAFALRSGSGLRSRSARAQGSRLSSSAIILLKPM